MNLRRVSGARAARRAHTAFTLLEVILSVAILAGSIASLGELMRLATLHQKDAVNLTQSQLLAHRKMVEIISDGAIPTAVTEARLTITTDVETEYPQWLYSITVNPTAEPALVELQLEVIQDVDPSIYRRARFKLVRWMMDQDALEAMLPEPPETEETAQ